MRGVCCVYALKACCFPSCCRAAPSWIAWYAVRVLSVAGIAVACCRVCLYFARGAVLGACVMVRPCVWVLAVIVKNILIISKNFCKRC